MSLISVENEVDAGINTGVLNAGELRDSVAPLRRIVAEDVVALSRERIGCGQSHVRIRAGELHLDGIHLNRRARSFRGMLRMGGQAQDRTLGSEKNAIA